MSPITETERAAHVAKLAAVPAQIAALVATLTPAQLIATPLAREWSIAQNVHHLVDSHTNAYIRARLMATEEHPTLKPYDQDAWAALPDAQAADISTSLAILHGLHARWAAFFAALPLADLARTGHHPERGTITIGSILAGYVDHSEAHIVQITRTLAAQR